MFKKSWHLLVPLLRIFDVDGPEWGRALPAALTIHVEASLPGSNLPVGLSRGRRPRTAVLCILAADCPALDTEVSRLRGVLQDLSMLNLSIDRSETQGNSLTRCVLFEHF